MQDEREECSGITLPPLVRQAIARRKSDPEARWREALAADRRRRVQGPLFRAAVARMMARGGIMASLECSPDGVMHGGPCVRWLKDSSGLARALFLNHPMPSPRLPYKAMPLRLPLMQSTNLPSDTAVLMTPEFAAELRERLINPEATTPNPEPYIEEPEPHLY